MIPVTIVSTDSGTSAEWVLEVDVPVIDAESVSMAMRRALAREAECPVDEIPHYTSEAWVARQRVGAYAFICRSTDPYFGEILITGIVYQRRSDQAIRPFED